MRRAAIGLLVGALAAVGCRQDSTGPADKPNSEAQQSQPPERAPFMLRFEAEGVDGGTVTLESLRGNVVLVDLFGTWCPPCRAATPALVSLYERYRGQGFEIVGLAYERVRTVDEAKASVRVYQRDFKVPYALALGPEELLKMVPDGFEGYPTMLLVDRQGLGRQSYMGYERGEEEALAAAIEKLLAEPGGP